MAFVITKQPNGVGRSALPHLGIVMQLIRGHIAVARLGFVISSPLHQCAPVLRNEDRLPSKDWPLHRGENPGRFCTAEAPAMSVGRDFAVEVGDALI
jgi:hypothetical protein